MKSIELSKSFSIDNEEDDDLLIAEEEQIVREVMLICQDRRLDVCTLALYTILTGFSKAYPDQCSDMPAQLKELASYIEGVKFGLN